MKPEKTENEKLLDVPEVAKRIRVTPQTVEKYIKDRLLGSYKIGKLIFVSEEKHLKPFLQKCERPAAV